MNLSETLPFPRLDAATDAVGPAQAIESLIRTQVAVTGQVWKANTETAEFIADRLRKDAAFVATLAATRLPTEAARLTAGHMQDAFADYAGHAMRFGALFRLQQVEAVTETPTPADSGAGGPHDRATAPPPAPAQARGQSVGKPPRREPV